MEKIIVEQKESNEVRVEEEYTEHSEALLKHWLEETKTKSEAHNKKGKENKKKHEWTALPATIIPIIYSPISGLLAKENGIEIANVTVLIFTGILSGVHSFFDFSKKAERHFRYEALYADLGTNILVELSKKRELRIRADRFIEQIQARIDQYNSAAPLL